MRQCNPIARFGREVAVKVLPAAFSVDPDRLRRIELSGMESTAVSVAGVEGNG